MKLGAFASLFGLSFSPAPLADRSDVTPATHSHHEPGSRSLSPRDTMVDQHQANECAIQGGNLATCYPNGNVPGNGQVPVTNTVKVN